MNSVEQYIANLPHEVQDILLKIRLLVLKHAPQAVEHFAYNMPAYKTNGKPLLYVAAFKNHIGFYATPTGHEHFSKQLSPYKQGKGSVQFPLSQPMPYDLIEQIIVYRINENLLKMNKSIQ